MLNCILETIIPAEPVRGLPSAAEIGFAAYCRQYAAQGGSDTFCALVDAVMREEKGLEREQQIGQKVTKELAKEPEGDAVTGFRTLDEDARLRVLNLCRSRDIRLFSSFITHVFRAYYSHPDVLARIGSGAVPPFPQGNSLASDDWTILEPVFQRGAVYRKVE
jgi:hypothetical protein